MEKNKVSTKQQLSRLVDLVNKNDNIGRGKRIYGSKRDEINRIWEKYAMELNSLGPPTRTAWEWQRVWIHYKANLKRKLARTKEYFEMSGDLGAFHEISLSATEEKACELTQMKCTISTTTEFSDERNDAASPPVAESSLIAENANPTTSKRAKTTAAQMQLLEAMAGKQKEMLRTLKKMQSTQHKLYQLKLRKLELLKKREREASALRNLRIKLAKAKLQQIKK